MSIHYITLDWSFIRDKNTTMQEKLLFAEICQLSTLDKGCIASNSHFAELLGVKRESVSRSINSLEKKGYIKLEIEPGSRNHKRKININKMLIANNKMLIPSITKCYETKENKRVFNKRDNSEFDKFWQTYPRKTDKAKALKAFNKINPSPELLKQIINHCSIAFKDKDKQYIPHPSTYLTGCRWEDEIIEVKKEIKLPPDDELVSWAIQNGLPCASPGESMFDYKNRLRAAINRQPTSFRNMRFNWPIN